MTDNINETLKNQKDLKQVALKHAQKVAANNIEFDVNAQPNKQETFTKDSGLKDTIDRINKLNRIRNIYEEVKFEILVGEIIRAVHLYEINEECKEEHELLFITDKYLYRMHTDHERASHINDFAVLESVDGDLDDLVDERILLCERVSSHARIEKEYWKEGCPLSWTFYRLATKKGYITLRWSLLDDYYSSDVMLERALLSDFSLKDLINTEE